MLVLEGVFQHQLQAIAHCAARANARPFEPGDLDVGQGGDGELRLRLEQVQDRKKISGQQEAKDLAPAIGKLDISVGPACAEHENLLSGLIADDDLVAGARYLK
jgi:hypothetical protein